MTIKPKYKNERDLVAALKFKDNQMAMIRTEKTYERPDK